MSNNAQIALRAAAMRDSWGRQAARRYVERMGCPVYLYRMACQLIAVN